MIKFTQCDHLEEKTDVLYDGPGYLYHGRLIYWEDEAHTVRSDVLFAEDRIVLKRTGEVSSETELWKNGEAGQAVISSPFGTFSLTAYLDESEESDDIRMVSYRILQNGETVTDQKLIWEMRGIADE